MQKGTNQIHTEQTATRVDEAFQIVLYFISILALAQILN